MNKKKAKYANMDLPLSPLIYAWNNISKAILKFLCLFTKYKFIGCWNNVLLHKKGEPMKNAEGNWRQEAFMFRLNMFWFRNRADRDLRYMFVISCWERLPEYVKNHPEYFLVE